MRARAIGVPVNARLVAIYTMAAAYAGIAGGLLAQTTQSASPDMIAFHRSADGLLMLVFGGPGALYGGLIGAVVFRVLEELIGNITSAILGVLARPGARADGALRPRWPHRPDAGGGRAAAARQAGGPTMSFVLETRQLCKRFGGIIATDKVDFRLAAGARHALIGPNGAGKTTFINQLTGVSCGRPPAPSSMTARM